MQLAQPPQQQPHQRPLLMQPFLAPAQVAAVLHAMLSVLRYPSTSFKEGNSYALEAGTVGGHAAAQTTPAAAIPKAPTTIWAPAQFASPLQTMPEIDIFW